MAGSRDFALSHAAHKNVVFPVGELVAGVEGHAGSSDRRHPEEERLLHRLLPRLLRHTRPEIEPAKADDGPTIILTRLQDIDLVAAIGPVLAFPDGPGVRIDSEPQRIAMAHRVDLRPVSRTTGKGVVRRNGSIVAQAQHLAGQVVWILRARRARRVADANRQVHHAIFAEDNPRRVAALNRGKDVADVNEGGTVPLSACKRDDPGVVPRVSGIVAGRLVIGEVDQLVLAEAWIQREVHQTPQALRLPRKYARDRIRIEHAVTYDAQASRTLRNEDATVRKKRHAPGLVESFSHDQTDLMLNASVENNRSVRERRRRPDDRRRRRRHSSSARALPGGLLRAARDSGENKRQSNNERANRIAHFHPSSP